MKTATNICKNCGNHFQLAYCNKCGQKATTNRITWHEIFNQLTHTIFHVDNGFFFTAKELAIRPGYSIYEYLQGVRKKHFSPVFMLILLGGLSSFLFVHLHIPTLLASVHLDELNEQNEMLVHKFFAIRTIFFCLICSVGDYFLFKENQYNFPEILLANIFTFIGVSLIQLLSIPLLLISENFNVNTYLRFALISVVIFYMFIVRFQLFKAKGNNLLIIKIIAAILLYVAVILTVTEIVVKPFFSE